MPTTTRSRTTEKSSSVLELGPEVAGLGLGIAPGAPGDERSEPGGRADHELYERQVGGDDVGALGAASLCSADELLGRRGERGAGSCRESGVVVAAGDYLSDAAVLYLQLACLLGLDRLAELAQAALAAADAREELTGFLDLINVALEPLVREGLELPGFSTLNEIAARVRGEINSGMFARILARMAQPEILRVNRLLEVGGGKSQFDWLKRPAGKASWSQFRE